MHRRGDLHDVHREPVFHRRPEPEADKHSTAAQRMKIAPGTLVRDISREKTFGRPERLRAVAIQERLA